MKKRTKAPTATAAKKKSKLPNLLHTQEGSKSLSTVKW